ncbi:MAG: hypothetical protein AB8H86_11005 [Polyangiales bacterium]
MVTLDALEILDEVDYTDTIARGTYEGRAIRISLQNATFQVTKGETYSEALVPIHGSEVYYDFESGERRETRGCRDVIDIMEVGSLDSRVRSQAGRRIALLVEFTVKFGPLVRNAFGWDGAELLIPPANLRIRDLTQSIDVPPEAEREEQRVPDWFEE